jgi:hypothetical protein
MSMHLEGPWLSTTGKKKGPKKWASAEAKKKEQQRKDEWTRTLKALDKLKPQFSREVQALKPALEKSLATMVSGPRVPPGRETPKIASLDTGWVACTKTADKTYTGTKVKGIGTMHKSNAVPIFSDEEAIDISKMRR